MAQRHMAQIPWEIVGETRSFGRCSHTCGLRSRRRIGSWKPETSSGKSAAELPGIHSNHAGTKRNKQNNREISFPILNATSQFQANRHHNCNHLPRGGACRTWQTGCATCAAASASPPHPNVANRCQCCTFQKTKAKAVVTLRPPPPKLRDEADFWFNATSPCSALTVKKSASNGILLRGHQPPSCAASFCFTTAFWFTFFCFRRQRNFQPFSHAGGLLFARSFVRLRRRLGGCWWQWRRSWWWLRRRLGVDGDCVSCLQVERVQRAARLQSRKYPRRIVCHTGSCPRTEYVPCWR